MHAALAAGVRRTPLYTLDRLDSLPCGCVAAVFRAQPLPLDVTSVEARGPHCVYVHHQIGRVLGVAIEDEPFGR